MFRKTLAATVAALTLATASLAPTSQAQAGGFGKFVAAGIVGAIVGGALAARPSQAYQPNYGYRPVRTFEGGYGGGYNGCGFRNSPIFDEDGNRIGSRRVSAC